VARLLAPLLCEDALLRQSDEIRLETVPG